MRKYHSDTFIDAFANLGIEKGDVLLIHNALFSFGMPNDLPLAQLSEKIYNVIRDLIGKKGTLVVPTFSFDFCKGVVFNKQETPSKLMGVFSEYVRTLPESIRSSHPMQSVSAIGPKAEEITRHDGQSAFENNGAFYKLMKLNAKVILLGTDYNAASVVHMVEEQREVPYRYWKTFTGEYIENMNKEVKSYQMFVRDLTLDPKLNMNSIEKKLKEHKVLKVATVGAGTIKSFPIVNYIEIANKLLASNPYYFVSNHQDFEKE